MKFCIRVKLSLALTSRNGKAVSMLMDYQKSFQRDTDTLDQPMDQLQQRFNRFNAIEDNF